MAHDQKITVVAGPWGVDVEPWLAQALATATVHDLQEQHKAGAVLFRLLVGEMLVGAYLLRVDKTAQGMQGVIVAGAGKCEGVDMLATIIPALEKSFGGVRSIRFHSQKPALVRKMARQGYRVQEVICVKEIA